MDNSQEIVARTTLRIAGVFQEITESWRKKLDSYFDELHALIKGEWLGPDDLRGILTESKMASHEALNGLGTDLSAQLVHESSGLFKRFETDRNRLSKKISELRKLVTDLTSNDEYSARRENQMFRKIIFDMPDFQILQVLQNLNHSTYSKLAEKTGLKKRNVRRIVKSLSERDYIEINKKKRPHVISFISAPWESNCQGNENYGTIHEFQSSYSINEEYSKPVEGPS